MKRVLVFVLSLFVAVVAVAGDGEDEKAASLKEALAEGEADVTFRYRFEYVDQDGFDKNANASTLRTTLSYRTQPWAHLSVFLEAENVTDIGTEDQYNNAAGNGVADRPVVADPEITEVNQSYLRWDNGATRLTAGREEFNWGDQRYVGAVAWRQNHQTFDGFSAINTSLEKVRFTYLFIANVNLIDGNNAQMGSNLLTGKIDLPLGSVDLYGLYLDYDRALPLSTASYGLEWTGDYELEGGAKLLWEAEYARQSDAASNPNNIDAGYLYLMFGGKLSEKLTIKGGWETLAGSPEKGQFRTPLATLHKWNGWADKFLVTPENGLEDLYLALNGKCGKLGWTAVYHDFTAESESVRYGTEFDAQISYPLPWGQVLALKSAFYRANDFATDTTKIWFYTTYKF